MGNGDSLEKTRRTRSWRRRNNFDEAADGRRKEDYGDTVQGTETRFGYKDAATLFRFQGFVPQFGYRTGKTRILRLGPGEFGLRSGWSDGLQEGFGASQRFFLQNRKIE
jgi:hypothetical protein